MFDVLHYKCLQLVENFLGNPCWISTACYLFTGRETTILGRRQWLSVQPDICTATNLRLPGTRFVNIGHPAENLAMIGCRWATKYPARREHGSEPQETPRIV